MANVVISGDTSGAITLAAPAVAGTNTITLPTNTGTAITTGSSNVVTSSLLSTGAVGTGVGFVRDAQAGWLGSPSFGYVIFQAPNGTRVAQCWGTTSFNSSGTASITFPITFSQIPNVTASVYRGSTLGGYLMSTQIGATTTTTVAIIGNYTTGGSVLNLTGNEAAAWVAWGPVA